MKVVLCVFVAAYCKNTTVFDSQEDLNSNFQLSWTVLPGDNDVKMQMKVRSADIADGYAAIAFSKSGSMSGSQAVVGLPTQLLRYDMSGGTSSFAPSTSQSGLTAMNVGQTSSNGVQVQLFSRIS